MRCMRNNNLAPVVQKVDSTIQQIDLYPVDSAIIGFPIILHYIAIKRLNTRALGIRIAGDKRSPQ